MLSQAWRCCGWRGCKEQVSCGSRAESPEEQGLYGAALCKAVHLDLYSIDVKLARLEALSGISQCCDRLGRYQLTWLPSSVVQLKWSLQSPGEW